MHIDVAFMAVARLFGGYDIAVTKAQPPVSELKAPPEPRGDKKKKPTRTLKKLWVEQLFKGSMMAWSRKPKPRDRILKTG